MRHPAVIVLEALLAGQEVELNGYTTGIGELDVPNGTPHEPYIRLSNPDANTVWRWDDYTLRAFIRDCLALPREKVFLLGCQRVLTEHNRRRT